MRVLLEYGDSGTGIQAPAPSLPFHATDIPGAVPRLIATARASLSPATADWLAELIGPDEIDVRAGPSRVRRLSIGRDSVGVSLMEADASRLFTAAPRFPDGIVRHVVTVPLIGKRRALVRELRRLGRTTLAFSIDDNSELQITLGTNVLSIAVVGPSFAELVERGGLFAQEKAPAFGGWGFGGIGSLRLSKAQQPWTRMIA